MRYLLSVFILWATVIPDNLSAEEKSNEVATFAGGCFWCVEADFEKVEGVLSAVSGFTGGEEEAPTYKDVAYGRTGHTEAVQVTYDPRRVSYKDLVDIFWRSIDPHDAGGQFCDRGKQYRTGIFYHDEKQKEIAVLSKQLLEKGGTLKQPIVTAIEPFREFYPADDSHQNFYRTNPVRYYSYRRGCGRDGRLKDIWSSRK